jgi:hypothetical protein
MTEARVDLAPLLDHCEISTQAPLYKPGNRRPCGGHLTVRGHFHHAPSPHPPLPDPSS